MRQAPPGNPGGACCPLPPPPGIPPHRGDDIGAGGLFPDGFPSARKAAELSYFRISERSTYGMMPPLR